MDYKIGRYINFLSNQFRAHVNYILKDKDLKYAECQVLLYVNHHHGASQDELTKFLQVDKAATARLIKKLVKKQLVIRTKDKKDQRINRLYLSDLASHKIEMISDIFDKTSLMFINGINTEDMDILMKVLDKMCDNASQGGDFYE